ncbi:MAG: hypothetical protein ACI9MC_004027, partial [Kiritimatiellia bacterium]
SLRYADAEPSLFALQATPRSKTMQPATQWLPIPVLPFAAPSAPSPPSKPSTELPSPQSEPSPTLVVVKAAPPLPSKFSKVIDKPGLLSISSGLRKERSAGLMLGAGGLAMEMVAVTVLVGAVVSLGAAVVPFGGEPSFLSSLSVNDGPVVSDQAPSALEPSGEAVAPVAVEEIASTLAQIESSEASSPALVTTSNGRAPLVGAPDPSVVLADLGSEVPAVIHDGGTT